MKLKLITGMMLTLLLIGMFTLAFNIQQVEASGTIYIRADGSVDPPTAPIQRDGDVYTFTDNIFDEIVVERDGIVVDGAGYTVQGTGSGTGIYLSGRSNIIIRNMEIKEFNQGISLDDSSNSKISYNNVTNNMYGIGLTDSSNNIISGNNVTQNTPTYGIALWGFSSYNIISGNNVADNYDGIRLYDCSNNTISGNTITNNGYGIGLHLSSNNSVSGNNVTANSLYGVYLHSSLYNTVSGNNITNNGDGIWVFVSSGNTVSGNNITNNGNGVVISGSYNNTISVNNITNNEYGIGLYGSSNNTIFGNNITNNEYGIQLYYSSNNKIYHNFISNTIQATTDEPYSNIWDDGYPSGGNFWSDYPGVDDYSGPYQNETGSDGIGDAPYVIDAENQDNYPLMNPWIERKVGVEVGDWAKYGNFVFTWSSNDPRTQPPSDLTEWMNVTVQTIVSTNITFQLTIHYQTSIEETIIGWIDVSTGEARGWWMPLFISANLSAGDTMYQMFFRAPINETIFREYVGVTRETNHFSTEWSFRYIDPDEYQNGSYSVYWDRATGILTEFMIESVIVDETLNYVTSTSISFQIVDTNLWKSPIASATTDINPNTLNLRSKGQWITAYIQLPEGYDAEDINASTILLNGTISPVLDPKYDFVTNSSEYLVDHNNDGILERMVKFNRTEVASWIYDDLGIQYGNVTLTITGEVDGAPFEGTDIVKVLFPGDVDDDGDCDRYDYGLLSAAYGTSVDNPAYVWFADFNEDQNIDRYDYGILAEYYGKTAV